MSEMPALSSSANQESLENRLLDASVHEAASDRAQAGSASPSDPASSLRAAALLTLKSKRRKPIPDQPAGLSHRPIPSGLVLNYGEEESSTPITTASSSTVEKTFISPSKPVPSEVDDNREEGEISDTETTPPAVPKPKAAPNPKKTMKAKAISDKKSTKASAKISPTSTKPPLHGWVLPTSPKQEIAQPAPVDGPSVPLAPPLPVTHYGPPQASHYVVDADHVRPGLAMNAQQYETAKDIVLDLLGWGVEPEYIAETGVSREIIFYVFTELHLRLPRNLDTTGLVPYYPSSPGPIQPPPPATQPRPPRSNSLSMPPPPSIPARHEAPSRVQHPSLPQKPPSPQVNPPTSPAPRPSSTSATQLAVLTTAYDLQLTKLGGANANLHEIEQQRKQELIARKAVQASRKNKANIANVAGPLSSSSSPSVVSPPGVDPSLKDVDMTNLVPASVDDFLKSIGSVSDAEHDTEKADSPGVKEALPAQYRRHASPDSMEVDEIPGFVTSRGDGLLSRPLSAHSLRDESVSRASTVSGAPTDPPSSTSSSSGFPEAAPTETGGSDYMKEDIPPGGSNSETIRRGTKRPVASDFVDFEAGPPRPYSTNGFSGSSGGSQPPSMRRKTTGSFASVSGMRRCVIDLSDSEDEGDGVLHRTEGDPRQRTFSPLPSRALATSASMPQMANGDWPPSQYHSNGNSGAQSPAALQAKEEEIKKMREMIAQKEQSRLRKLAVMSRMTTSPALATNPPPGQKQEDDDSLGNIAPSPTNGLLHDVVTDGPQRKNSGSIIPISDSAASGSVSGNTSASATPPIGSLSPSLAPTTSD